MTRVTKTIKAVHQRGPHVIRISRYCAAVTARCGRLQKLKKFNLRVSHFEPVGIARLLVGSVGFFSVFSQI